MHKTRTKRVRFDSPIKAWAPGNVPPTLPNADTIGQALVASGAQVIGELLSGLLGYYVEGSDGPAIANFVNSTRPSSNDVGNWPDDPCN